MKNSIDLIFDSTKSNNISKESDNDLLNLNLNNLSIEELLNTDDIIEKMSIYKNKSMFSQ